MNQPQVVVNVQGGQSTQHFLPSTHVSDAARLKQGAKPPKVTRGTEMFCQHREKEPGWVSLAWVAKNKKFQPAGKECKSCGNKRHCAEFTEVRCARERLGRRPSVIPVIKSARVHHSASKECKVCTCGRELCAATKQLGLAKN